MTTSLSGDVLTLLRRPLMAHVATVMPDGTPQSTPVWIDTDGTDVLFNTAKGRVKHRNLLQNPAGMSTSTPWPRSTSGRTATPSASQARSASS